jgi:hypothetical protein
MAKRTMVEFRVKSPKQQTETETRRGRRESMRKRAKKRREERTSRVGVLKSHHRSNIVTVENSRDKEEQTVSPETGIAVVSLFNGEGRKEEDNGRIRNREARNGSEKVDLSPKHDGDQSESTGADSRMNPFR